jgi:phage-related protein (TIGR01555 family)
MDPIIKKIINIIVRAVFQNEFEIICKEDNDYFKKFKDLWEKNNLKELTRKVARYGYVHGHAFLLLDLDDSNSDAKHLNMSKVKNINRIDAINRYFFAPDISERNFSFDPTYYYLVQQPVTNNFDMVTTEGRQNFSEYVNKLQGKKIHYTRMLPYWGNELDPYLFRTNLHFHDSYIRCVQEAAKNYHNAMDNLSTLMSKVPYAIAKIENLYNTLSVPDERKKLAEAMRYREQQRSSNNVSVMDTKEDYNLFSPTLAGFAELSREIKERLCVQCEIPHDILFGEGSTGQTTGRTEKTNFERFITSEREVKLQPIIKFFMKLFEQVYGLQIPENYQITFDHTEQQTELEASQTLVNNATACASLNEQGFDCSEFIMSKYQNIKKDEDFSGLLFNEDQDKKI